MLALHPFKDECLIRMALKMPGVTLSLIGELKRRQKPYLSQALIDAGLATPKLVGQAVGAVCHVAFVEPTLETIDGEALKRVPEKMCRRHFILPYRWTGACLEIATADPMDLAALDDVQAVSGCRAVACYCVPGELAALIDAVFPPAAGSSESLAQGKERETNAVFAGSHR